MPLLCPYGCFVLHVSSCQFEKGANGENSHFVGRLLERIGFHRCGAPVLRSNEQVSGLVRLHVDCPCREDTPFRSSGSAGSRYSQFETLKFS